MLVTRSQVRARTAAVPVADLVSSALVTLVAAFVTSFLRGGTLWETLDGQAHIFRLFALERSIVAGDWYPRVPADLLAGYGYPVFNFIGPLSYYLALPFRLLGMSHLDSTEAVTAASFAAAGLGVYWLARRSLPPVAALVAAAGYTVWPYRLVVIYVRGDVPEALALALAPWAALAVLRVADHPSRGRALTVAVLFAGIVLAHNITSLLLAPVLGSLALWPAVRDRRPLAALAPIAALLGGAGLSAFFWLPALWETRWLHTDRLYVGDYAGSLASLAGLLSPTAFAYHYYPDTGNPEITFPPGFLVLLVAVPGVTVLFKRGLTAGQRAAGLGALVLLGVSLAGMWKPLAPLLSPLELIQAPYRLLGPAALGAAMLAGLGCIWLNRLATWARWMAALVLVIVLTASATLRLAPSTAQPPESLSVADLNSFEQIRRFPGTTWAGEFMPRWTTADPMAMVTGEAVQGDPAAAAVDGSVRVVRWGQAGVTVRTRSTTPFALALRRVYVPGWRANVDGRPAEAAPMGPRGLLGVAAPAGEHEVEFRFGPTGSRLVGGSVAGLSILAPWLLWPWVFARNGSSRRPWVSLVGTPVCVGLAVLATVVLSGVWSGPAASGEVAPGAVRVAFGDRVQLASAELAPVRAGEPAAVTLYWLATAPIPTDYKVFLQVLDASGKRVAQFDSAPVGGASRTSAWRPGELIRDEHMLTLPADVPAGEYRLLAGFYDKSGKRPAVSMVNESLPPGVTIVDGNAVEMPLTVRR